MSIDWQAAARAARRAEAAYIEDQDAAKAAFSALGDTFIDQYKDGSHQAVLSADSQGRAQLSISGTRASTLHLQDVFDDIDLAPRVFGPGAGTVASGAYEGMQALWGWVNETVDWRAVLDVQGHSLGAARTHFTPMFRASEHVGRLHSFESPKFADAAYYARYSAALAGMVCTLNGRDMWAAWPWMDCHYSRPQPAHVWLSSTGFSVLDGVQWPGTMFADSNGDHSITLVAERLAALAARYASAAQTVDTP